MTFFKKLESDLKKLTNWLTGGIENIANPKKKEVDLKNLEKKKADLKDLQKKTKKELEKIGRKVGIELDRRLTKDKLIKQIKKVSK